MEPRYSLRFENGDRKGESIPIGARIVAVVDAWDAMTTDRPYRRSLGEIEAIRRLKLGSGSQWDSGVVDRFLDLLAAGELRPADLPEGDALPPPGLTDEGPEGRAAA